MWTKIMLNQKISNGPYRLYRREIRIKKLLNNFECNDWKRKKERKVNEY